LAAEPRLSDVASFGVAIVVAVGLRTTGLCPAELCAGGIVDTAAAIVTPLGTMLAVGWRLLRRLPGRGDDEPAGGGGARSARRSGERSRSAVVRPLVKRPRRHTDPGRGEDGSAAASEPDARVARPSGEAVVVPSMWPPVQAATEMADHRRDADRMTNTGAVRSEGTSRNDDTPERAPGCRITSDRG
jgi:hypothetical protein